MQLNKKFWKGKKILITGHTGFKGGWLSVILNLLGSKISGFALDPQGKNNFFNSTKIKKFFKYDFRHDISDINYLKKSIKKIKPEIIFHVAAQSSVIESFKNSRNTVMTNTIGTANILEAAKYNKHIKCLFIITTDKVYQNYGTKKYFDENSKLGGDDIYSGSKACCEILVNSYRKSFFRNSKCRIVTVRAGNCFGGGDWTKERIAKDALECFYNNKTLTLRMPEATRPWQHVIEPLFGYILLVQKLCSKGGKKYDGAWNFGPSLQQNLQVIKFAKMFRKKMNSKSKIVIKRSFGKIKNTKVKVFESKNLSIDTRKVYKFLNWSPSLSIESAINLTIEWYKAFKKKQDLLYLTKVQILNYIKKTSSI